MININKGDNLWHLWQVKYTVGNDSPNKEPCQFGDGSLYIKATDIFDAIEKANVKLKSFGFDVSVLHSCHYGR